MTSGNPIRIARWVSVFAYPRSSKGRWRSLSMAPAIDREPSRTASRSFSTSSGFMAFEHFVEASCPVSFQIQGDHGITQGFEMVHRVPDGFRMEKTGHFLAAQFDPGHTVVVPDPGVMEPRVAE